MTLPNFFLADLPPEAELTAGMVTEACRTLRRNRDQYLRDRSTTDIIDLLAGVAEEWRQPESPFRQLALAHGPATTGFSAPTLAAGLDEFFASLTPGHLEALVAQELGHANRLDALVSTAPEEKHARAGTAFGPALLAHIAAGNLPPPTLTSMVLGLLTRSAQFVKCPRHAAFLPRLFAHSLYEADAKIGACLEVAAWSGGDALLEDALFAEAECITATGGDAAIAAIRDRVPHGKRFVGYGHRVSFGYVTREKLTVASAKRLAADATRDICAWDQLGCLSPHVIFVEAGGKVTPELFAELLAGQLAAHEALAPRGPLALEDSAAISSRRTYYEVRAANRADTRLWASDGSTAWTVVYEDDPQFQLSCLNRFVYVKAVESLAAALHGAEMVRGQVSTVGLAADATRANALAHELGRWGVTRVCPLGRMQSPPLTWRHDGRPALGDLVTWMDWER
jgi:Acyl-CoA reductase (LuxC)